MDWEKYCGLLAADILREQSPRQLLTCRGKVYDLLVNCIPADVVVTDGDADSVEARERERAREGEGERERVGEREREIKR
jgi:hypothetical protein